MGRKILTRKEENLKNEVLAYKKKKIISLATL